MNIGEVAEKTGVERANIRFYEAEGVLPAPARSAAGYRTYGAEDLDLIRFVKRARSLGISLDDIKSIVALRNENEAPCSVVREVISTEAQSIERRIAELQDLHNELVRLERLAAEVADDWPDGACVCHIVEATV